MEKSINRSAYWDNIKGFLIFLVVFAHCLYDFRDNALIGNVVNGIYLFHMPAFIFVSGFFGKSERSQSKEAIVKLLFAYFIFNTLLGLRMGLDNILLPIYSYWYLLALVLWRLTAKYVSGRKAAFISSVVVSVAVGFVSVITNTFALARFIAFFPFYLFGFMLPKENAEALRDAGAKKLLSVGLIALALAVGLGYVVINVIGFDCEAMQMSPYSSALDALGRMGTLLTAALAIIAIMAFCPKRNLPFLTVIGRNSLAIFIIHRPITIVFSTVLKGYSPSVVLLASLAASIIICLVCGCEPIGKLVNRYLDDGAELVLNNRSPEKSRLEYTAVSLSALIIALALLVLSIAQM